MVVSIGETRRFNFRRILDGGAEQESEKDHHSFHLKDGDVVYMFDDCQVRVQRILFMFGHGALYNKSKSHLSYHSYYCTAGLLPALRDERRRRRQQRASGESSV